MINRIEHHLMSSALATTHRLLFFHVPPIPITSCHRLLVEIATDLARQNPILSFLRKLPPQAMNEDLRTRNPGQYISQILSMLSSEGGSAALQCAHLLLLDEEILKKQNNIPIFFLVLPNLEQISMSILIDLIEYFQTQSWQTILLLSGSQLIIPSIFLEEKFQSLCNLHQHDLCSPWELYDQFAIDVFPTNKLPVHFPATVLRSLHMDFTNTTQCISTMIER